MEDAFCRIVQLSLTAYLECFHPLNAETLSFCTKQDNLQENAGVGTGVMFWLYF